MSTGGIFAGPAPRWFTIPAHRPFLADLAQGLIETLGIEGLTDAVVLLPSRRSARALAEAFVEAAGAGALLLPQIRALGDLDEGESPFEPGDVALGLPPAIAPYRRRFELARLIAANEGVIGRSLDAAGAMELADALAAFLDGAELEEVPEAERRDRVRALADGDLARHWRISVDVLDVALAQWPVRLAQLGLVDLSARRVKLLRALADKWAARPPSGPMIAAGSTGTARANADLLGVIAGLPQGAVVLPGLDLELADTAWSEVGEQHPQGAMKRLIERAGADRGDVRRWPASPASVRGRWRRRIVNEAMRPAEATADWLRKIAELKEEGAKTGVDPMAEGLAGLTVISARDEEEAAAKIAILLRETLETPGRTAALITPDRVLARRVAARLARWGLDADSSAGKPLSETPIGILAALVARAASDPADPVRLLAILKHPLVRLGLDGSELERARDALERYGLRGPRRETAHWIDARLAEARLARGEEADTPPERLAAVDQAERLLGLVRRALAPASDPYADGKANVATAARGLAMALEALSADARGDAGGLWAGPEGEAAAGLLAALIEDGGGLPPVGPAGFADLIERLMQGETARAVRAAHPRLKILGAIESRLVDADRLILAGLEEGVWPQAAPTDPFLSRPMRERFGLPPPERRIGLSAHDFAQAACAPEVFLVHSERREGAPAVRSRWLWRLGALAAGAGLALPGRPELDAWAAALDAPGPFSPAARPKPAPPVEVRPRALPVTGVETWVRDPYAIYARYILRLRPLERPDEPVEARARGEAVHRALQRFAEAHPEALPEGGIEAFNRLLVEALAEAGLPGAAMAREHALAARAAPWVIDFEARRRPGARLLVEQKGKLEFDSPLGRFTLTARADRLELREGIADILDFKTGRAPSLKQVKSGLAPQLTLTAAILWEGGFEAAGTMAPGELVYVRLSGGRKPGEELVRGTRGESGQLAREALEGLRRRIAWFADPGRPYVSWAAPQFLAERAGDYDHLARVWEWHVLGEGETAEGEA